MKKSTTALLLLLAAVGIFVYVCSVLVPMIDCYYHGKETVAEVAKVRTEEIVGLESSHVVFYYTLIFDGHQVEKRAGGKRAIGARFPVIYLPDDPSSVVSGSRALGLGNAILRSTNEITLAITLDVGVILLMTVAKILRTKAA